MSIFTENNGKVSAVRIGMFICILTACYLAIAGLHLDRDLFTLAPLCGLFLGIGIGGKVYQKGNE